MICDKVMREKKSGKKTLQRKKRTFKLYKKNIEDVPHKSVQAINEIL